MGTDQGSEGPALQDLPPHERLDRQNALLAEWAAASAAESAPLLERLEALGYAVRGKSREAISEVLRHPPTEPPRA